VPLHKVRRRERGFDPRELLSKRLARRLGLPRHGIRLSLEKPRH
jgi:predicted amidophosphoribosyltransferase